MDKKIALSRQESDLFKDAGLYEDDWQNVIQHSKVVASFALRLGTLVSKRQTIDLELLRLGALFHDADKKMAFEAGIGYADEHNSSLREELLRKHSYGEKIQKAAKYAGRVPHMFRPKDSWADIIAREPIEHLLIGYVDARARGESIVSLQEACFQNTKKLPKDARFYEVFWLPFYREVEGFLSRCAAVDLSQQLA